MQQVLTSIVFLACPVGMGLMMWFMVRGNRQQQPSKPETMSLAELRTEHERLGAEMDRAAVREEART